MGIHKRVQKPDYRGQVLGALVSDPDTWWNRSAIAQVADISIRDVLPSLTRAMKAGYVVTSTQPGTDGKLQKTYKITVKGVEALWSGLGE